MFVMGINDTFTQKRNLKIHFYLQDWKQRVWRLFILFLEMKMLKSLKKVGKKISKKEKNPVCFVHSVTTS